MKGKLQKMIEEVLGIKADKINIIPNTIPLETQIAYFETSKRVKENLDPDTVLKNAYWLFNDDISIEDKKWLLAQLASISNPEAYRTIERFVNQAPSELIDWAKIALIESRTVLESDLLDQQQIIVSSGLGGEEHRLRYFVVFKAKSDFIPLGDYQKKLINIETQTILEKNDGILEEMIFYDEYAAFTMLLPLTFEVNSIVKSIIEACNQYGNFLSEKFLITNVKKLTYKEIKHFLNKTENNESTD